MTTCNCLTCVEHRQHRLITEAVTKRELGKLTDSELRTIIQRYKLTVPATNPRDSLIRAIVRAAPKFGNVYPFDAYPKTPVGVERRIKALSQTFTFKHVNNSLKLLGQHNDVQWLHWLTMGDDRVCPICLDNSQKGDAGYFAPTEFMPDMPAHVGCRCQWQVVWVTERSPEEEQIS